MGYGARAAMVFICWSLASEQKVRFFAWFLSVSKETTWNWVISQHLTEYLKEQLTFATKCSSFWRHKV
jgi:hypothetical protein